MPELPDVEHYRKIAGEALNRKIVKVEVHYPANIRRTHIHEIGDYSLEEGALGARLTELERRGKYLIAYLDNGRTVVFHLMMAGWLVFLEPSEPVPAELERFGRVRFGFQDGSALWFADRRNMGHVYLLPDRNFSGVGLLERLGVEPLSDDFTYRYWHEVVGRHGRQMIKQALVDQTEIAGIGNVYGDEILYRAGIRPTRQAEELLEHEIRAVYDSIKEVLTEAVTNYGKPGIMKLPRRKGAPCPRDRKPVEAVKKGGRHYYFCPSEQK